jgi:hypothetical protein
MTKLATCEVSQSSKRILLNEHQYSGSGLDSYSIGSLDLADKTDRKLLKCWMFSLADWRLLLQLEIPHGGLRISMLHFLSNRISVFFN